MRLVSLRVTFWSLFITCVSLVVLSSLPYLLPSGNHPFLAERPHLAANTLWRGALALHVATGILALPSGAFLLSASARRRWPGLHRNLGGAFVILLIVGLVPSGTYLSMFSKGGIAAGSGFFLSGVFTAASATYSTSLAIRGHAGEHRNWMLRAYAQLASAISFRVVHLALQFSALSYEELYVSSLWISVLGNAALAEVWIASNTLRRRSLLATSQLPST